MQNSEAVLIWHALFSASFNAHTKQAEIELDEDDEDDEDTN